MSCRRPREKRREREKADGFAESSIGSEGIATEEAVDLWLERSYLASNSSAPLFPSFGKNRETINRDAWIVGVS